MIGRQSFYADEAPVEMAALSEGLESLSLQGAMADCAVVMKQSVRDNFTSSASPDGSNWPPRKQVGDGHPLLIDTGASYCVLTRGTARKPGASPSDPGTVRSARSLTSDSAACT